MELQHSLKTVKCEKHHSNFILNSWLKNYRESKEGKCFNNNGYFPYFAEIVKSILSRSSVFVLEVGEGHDTKIVSWICFEGDVLHYAYIRSCYKDEFTFNDLLAKFPKEFKSTTFPVRGFPVYLHTDPVYRFKHK